MNIALNTPQIKLLIVEVERRTGFRLATRSDFGVLVSQIETDQHEHISESTLERVWQYSTRRNKTVALHTLDLLSRFAGYADWNDFTRKKDQEMHPESARFEGTLNISQITEGQRIRISWYPDRICVIRYLGENRFVVEEVEKSSITVGDSFSCNHIQPGQPLYMDHYCRMDEPTPPTESNARYVVGRDNGLIEVTLLTE